MDPNIIYQIVVLLLALSFHEMAHAWAAYRLGDSTAASRGRMTMNPLAHIDPFGTVLFPALLIFSGLPVFGWAKPVPVNPYALRSPRRDYALVAAAGPGSNILLALAGASFFWMLGFLFSHDVGLVLSARTLMVYVVYINLLLAFFNLIPLPPLDGGGILLNLLPAELDWVGELLRNYGFLLLIFLIMGKMTFIFVKPAWFLGNLLLYGW